MKKYDVVALGELLIDFTDSGLSGQGNKLFEANPGGAPCNVLAMLQKLENNTAFIGRVGKDMFGRILKDRVSEQGIDTTYLSFDENIPTTLAFVNKLPNGDRDFAFYRKPGADMMLDLDDVLRAKEALENTGVFHFGTLSMTSESAREATEKSLEIAKGNGAVISFDPNYREPLWKSEQDAIKAMEYGFDACDILKISDNEIELCTGEKDIIKGARILKKEYDITLVFATMGADGSAALYKELVVKRDGFKNAGTIETTGAGDTFCACALDYVYHAGLEELTKSRLEECLTFANAAASIITTRKGALAVMPSGEEIEEFLSLYSCVSFLGKP